jgi:hypothetical protein
VDLDPTGVAVIITATAGAGRLVLDWWRWRTERRDKTKRRREDGPPDDTQTLAA